MRHGDEGGIGWRIARARKENGLTQEELAVLIGVSPRSIQGYEAGKVVPYRRLSRLAEATNRQVGWMLEGNSDHESALDDEIAERLIKLVDEVSEEAKRIREVAERLERLLGATQPIVPAQPQSGRGSGARM